MDTVTSCEFVANGSTGFFNHGADEKTCSKRGGVVAAGIRQVHTDLARVGGGRKRCTTGMPVWELRFDEVAAPGVEGIGDPSIKHGFIKISGDNERRIAWHKRPVRKPHCIVSREFGEFEISGQAAFNVRMGLTVQRSHLRTCHGLALSGFDSQFSFPAIQGFFDIICGVDARDRVAFHSTQ